MLALYEVRVPQTRDLPPASFGFHLTMILRPLTGKWMDEWNRKKIVLFSLALFMLCTALYPLVHQYAFLLGLRFLHGIGFGMATTAAGAVAIELVPERRKGEGIGYLFMSLAMVVNDYAGSQ